MSRTRTIRHDPPPCRVCGMPVWRKASPPEARLHGTCRLEALAKATAQAKRPLEDRR